MRDLKRLYNSVRQLERKVDAFDTETTLVSTDLTETDLYSGDVLYAGTSSQSGISTGQLVYMDDSEQWRKASSGCAECGSKQLIGIALSDEPHDDGVFAQGPYRLDSSFVSGTGGVFTAGSQVFIHLTSGSYSTTVPDDATCVRVVGHSIDSDIIYFNPSQDYIDL